jgi:cephalosporin hydroxylase
LFGRARIRELEAKLARAERKLARSERRAEVNAERAEKRLERIQALTARSLSSEEGLSAVERFHKIYYGLGWAKKGTWFQTYWFGVPVWKCPLDLWIYQEILVESSPDFVIETGTAHGGSALYFAHVFDLLGSGQVITVDIEEKPDRPEHPRITYLSGSSTAPEILDELKRRVSDSSALVALDSNHSRDHVLDELKHYPTFVKQGGYLIVEDTNVNGHPILPDFGPGPMEAVDEFLEGESGRAFVRDNSKEKLLMTFNPGGFLKRTGA